MNVIEIVTITWAETIRSTHVTLPRQAIIIMARLAQAQVDLQALSIKQEVFLRKISGQLEIETGTATVNEIDMGSTRLHDHCTICLLHRAANGIDVAAAVVVARAGVLFRSGHTELEVPRVTIVIRRIGMRFVGARGPTGVLVPPKSPNHYPRVGPHQNQRKRHKVRCHKVKVKRLMR